MRPQGNFFFLESRTTNLLWLGLLGLVVIFFFMLVFEAVAIESALGKHVAGKLSAQGYNRTEVSVSGRDVTVSGEVSSIQARQRLLAKAFEVEGVRQVDADVEIVPLRLSHIRMRRDQTGWQSVSGALPTQDAVGLLRSQLGLVEAADSDGVFQVQSDVEVTESDWLEMIPDLLQAMQVIENLFVEIGAYDMIIGGSVDSAAEYAGAIALLENLSAKHQLTLVNRLATINRLP